MDFFLEIKCLASDPCKNGDDTINQKLYKIMKKYMESCKNHIKSHESHIKSCKSILKHVLGPICSRVLDSRAFPVAYGLA